jgi:hypothetical protein
MMSPAALSLLTTTFTHGRDRVRALGAYGAVSAGGGALGVILGGLLTSGPGWRWVLFVNVPVAAAIMAVTPLLIRGERGGGTGAGLEASGALLVTAGLTVLTYTLIRAATMGWVAPATIAGLPGAAVLLLAFILNEARAAAPLMPLRIFTVPGLAAANGVLLLAFGAVFSVVFFLSLYMQEVLGYSAAKTGLAFLPLPLGIMVVVGATSRIIERAGTNPHGDRLGHPRRRPVVAGQASRPRQLPGRHPASDPDRGRRRRDGPGRTRAQASTRKPQTGPRERRLPLNLPLSLIFPGGQLAAVSGRMPSSASPSRSFSTSRS